VLCQSQEKPWCRLAFVIEGYDAEEPATRALRWNEVKEARRVAAAGTQETQRNEALVLTLCTLDLKLK
jgi:hypothetical protein